MFMSRHAFALLTVAAAACSTTDAAPAPATPASSAATASTDPHATCVQLMTRNRTCTDEFLPMLVDLRAKHDRPAGIAAEVAADRAGVIAKARSEWATDSTDAAIAQVCSQLIASPAAAHLAAGTACLAEATCTPYVACIAPIMEQHLTAPQP